MLVYCFWPTILPQSRKTGLGREVVTRRCPKCGHHKRLTKHHVYPVRWKGDWDQTQSQTTVALCAECHAGIERVIELFELRGSQYLRGPMAAEFYPAVLEWYLDQEVTSAVIDCIWGVRPKRDREPTPASISAKLGEWLQRLIEHVARVAVSIGIAIVGDQAIVFWRPMPVVI